MTYELAQLHDLAIAFPQEHRVQIRLKAAKWVMPADDVGQEARVVILEKGHLYDPEIGTFCAFVFGHLEMRMRRQLGAHRFAISLDVCDQSGQELREAVESMPTANQDESAVNQLPFHAPGAAKILSIAQFASGKSVADLAQKMGQITPRRVRQILQKLREDQSSMNQFELSLDGAF